jgi:hypothetical protein
MAQEKRKPKNSSFGVFPSLSAVNSASSKDLQKVYFATASKSQFTWQSGTLPQEDRTENFNEIHSVGKKHTKYMKFQPSKAPLVDRTACKYTQEFTPKPLGDCETNNALAQNFKQGGMSRGFSSPMLQAKSSYKDTFAGHDHDAMRSAKQRSCKPKKVLTQTLGGAGGLLETTSNSHNDHRAPPLALAKPGEVILPKPNITLTEKTGKEFFKTQAKRDFVNPAMYAASMPPSLTQGPEFPPLPLTVVDDDTIYNCRRACFLSPGQ